MYIDDRILYQVKKLVFFMHIWAHQLGFWCKNKRNEIHCIVSSLRDPCHIVCAPIWQHSYILCKTTGALFYLKSVTDHVILTCLTCESSVFYEQHVREMCHMSLRHWQIFPAFSLFILYSLFFHSVYPVTNMTSDTSSSVYILYVT